MSLLSQKKSIYLVASVLPLLCAPMLWCSPACAQEQAPLWSPVADFSYKGGNKRHYGTVSLMLPFAQSEDSLLFADIRTVVSDQDSFEGNAGLGIRKIAGHDAIFGAYGFFDTRLSAYDNVFQQATFGAEMIGEHFEVRGNVYRPVGEDKKLAYDNGASAFISGNNFMIQDGRIYERALKGFDVEIGHSFPVLENARGYIGYYNFHNDGVTDVSGYRARVETDIGDWVEIGAEKQFSDTTQDDAVFGEIRIRIPFDGWTKGGERRKAMSPLQKRMMVPIVRDIDVVTKTLPAAEPVKLMMASGNEPAKVYFVDNTAATGGDGTKENPFNTLAQAEAAAGPHDTIYVAAGDGTTAHYDQGITMDDAGQRLVGSGAALTFDRSQFQIPTGIGSPVDFDDIVFIPAQDVAPIITNAADDGITVTADDVVVTGVTVDGAADDNIYVHNADNLTIKNVTTSNAADDGLFMFYNDGGAYTISIENSQVNDNGDNGLGVSTQGNSMLSSTISGNIIKNNTVNGVTLSGYDNSTQKGTIDNNIIEYNGNSSVMLRSYTDASLEGTVYNNTMGNNGNFGIVLYADNDSSMKRTVYNNTITKNGRDGVYVDARRDAVVESVFRNNTITDNSFAGLSIRQSHNAQVKQEVYDNTVTDNGTHGLYFTTLSSKVTENTVSGNIITGNDGNGVRVYYRAGAGLTVDLGGGALGSAGQNAIYGNGAEEVFVDLDGGELKAENNWWGDATGLQPAEVDFDDGTIDADPYLTSAPD